jgi:hypothetical protein
MINVYLTPIERLDEYWPYIEDFMAGAARFTYGRYEAEDIYDLLAGGDHELWVTYEDDETIIGATVTAVYNYPKTRTLSMVFCGGVRFAEWKDIIIPMLREYAKMAGCDRLESNARKGWAKIFKNDGYVQKSVYFELPL